MLIKHSLLYFLSRAFPGAINLIALAVYTRLLSPNEYGRYALVIYGVGLASTLLYWWLRLGLIRFAPRFADNQAPFLATLLRGFVFASGTSLLLVIACLLIVSDPQLRVYLAFSTVLLWVNGWFDLNLELIRSRLSPLYFGALSLVRALLALLVGASLAWLGLSAWGILIGALVSTLLPGIWVGLRSWRGIDLRGVDRALLRELLAYGLPLIGVFGMEYVISTSDRFMLSWLLDTSATGVYSAAYDLTSQSLILVMSVVYLGGYPLVVKTFETEGAEAARRLLSRYLGIFFALALPAATALALLSPGISGTLLGSRFHEDAARIMPWIAMATLLAGLKSYYLDLTFQLSRRTRPQLVVAAVPALLNLLLNAWWIPKWGVDGAAYATFAAYLCAVALSYFIGRAQFVIPVWNRQLGAVLIAGAAMVAVAMGPWARYDQAGLAAWVGEAVLLLAVYGGVGLALNVGGARDGMTAWVRRRVRD